MWLPIRSPRQGAVPGLRKAPLLTSPRSGWRKNPGAKNLLHFLSHGTEAPARRRRCDPLQSRVSRPSRTFLVDVEARERGPRPSAPLRRGSGDPSPYRTGSKIYILASLEGSARSQLYFSGAAYISMPPRNVPRVFPPAVFKGPKGSGRSGYIFSGPGYIPRDLPYISRNDPYIGRGLPKAAGEAPYISMAGRYMSRPPWKRSGDTGNLPGPRFSPRWNPDYMAGDAFLYASGCAGRVGGTGASGALPISTSSPTTSST